MTPTQKLQQIKNWLFNFEKNHAFARYKGENEVEYEVDGEISTGKELYSVNTDGTTQLAADGDYTIEGKVINVIRGVIQDVISDNRVIEPKTINEENKQESMLKKVAMVSDSLIDGTEISISGDQIIAGADLRIVKDGEELLPPAGEHQLNSGVVVVVDDAGKIVEVKPAAEKPEIEVKSAEENPMEDVKDTGVKSVEEMVKQVMEAVAEMKQAMTEMKDNHKKMKEDFAKFKKEPAAEPLKRNSVSNDYQFGSGSHPRVQMMEALRGSLK